MSINHNMFLLAEQLRIELRSKALEALILTVVLLLYMFKCDVIVGKKSKKTNWFQKPWGFPGFFKY